MLTEIAEEYLECVYDLTQSGEVAKTSEIAAKMGLAPATVTEMLQKLAADDYLDYERYKGVKLTRRGLRVARKIKRKHRLVERFLVDVVGTPKEESHEEACRLEHVLSDDAERRICQMTNNPKFCPDGNPIPECTDECSKCSSEPSVPLLSLKSGEKGLITHLKCDDQVSARRLISMGFVPGRQVVVDERVPMGGPLLVKLEGSLVAISKEYAALVNVGAVEEEGTGVEPGHRGRGRGKARRHGRGTG
jgi:DtxR family Mn-dependent transcriptional regulator